MDQNNGESTASGEIMYDAETGEQVFYDVDNSFEPIPIITEEEIDNSRVVRRRLRSFLSTGISPSNESLGPMTESEVVALYNESNERPIQGSSTNNPILPKKLQPTAISVSPNLFFKQTTDLNLSSNFQFFFTRQIL